MKNQRLPRALLATLLLSLAACHPSPANPDQAVVRKSMAKPSFSANIQPILNIYCATAGCHAGASPAAGMDLTYLQSYNQLVDVTANIPVTCIDSSFATPVTTIATTRVSKIYADPYRSVLTHRLDGTCNSLPVMPDPANPLDQGQIDMIVNWITSGAPNN